ncbi:chromate transporter [Agaricicola taiwanensis]|uniref:Chromate transporter n=1 Tax=Agaricicola taiwanensis TaxID=591372 RepID=A0A8J2VL17_9RHOB|nr:chromate transporter [Agaricicola taiwanensis]GGE27517.1 chromate transporter [Agaricicola taiwanensis]
MNWQLLLDIVTVFISLSVVSIGGANAVLPDIRRQVVDVHGWMNEATFADLFAISHAAPGPNVIMVSLIGWHMAGFFGLVAATLAILVPSSLIAFAVGRVVNRWSDKRWIAVAKQGLVPIAVGLILASGISMIKAADHNLLLFLISLGTAAFMAFAGRNPLWALAGGTLLNILALQLGWPG